MRKHIIFTTVLSVCASVFVGQAYATTPAPAKSPSCSQKVPVTIARILFYQSASLPANVQICAVGKHVGSVNWLPTANGPWTINEPIPAGTCMNLGAVYGVETNTNAINWMADYRQFSPACN